MKQITILALSALSTFAVVSSAVADTTPAALNTPAKADPAAHDLLKAAHDSRATFAGSFSGITADVTFDDNGTEHKGKVVYSTHDDATITVPDLNKEQGDWLEDQVGSVYGHRRGGDFDKGEGKNPITFGPDDHSPIGRQVVLHDGLESSYRIRDKQVVEVTRTMGGQRFTITVLETTLTDEGKYLPRQFMVTYFNAKTGAIQQVDAFSDTYAKVDGCWLPTSRRVITAEDGGFKSRQITFANIHVQK